MKRGLAILAVVALWAAACRTASPVPDLSSLYGQIARYHDETTNPVIVIPGILGSKLTDPASGRTVWGAFGGGAANPQKPDGARLFALPMGEGEPLRELRDEVVADGVLDKIHVKMGFLPFQLKAYFQILQTLGAGGYKDANLSSIDYGAEHFTCFQFDYDWRRDNVESAQRLHEFIEEKRAYVLEESRKRFGKANPDLKFDLIAHSMGGLLVRYFLRYGAADLPADGSLPPLTWAGSEHIERVVLIAPPNAGSVDAVVELIRGRKFGPLTPKYPPAVMATFPSVFQLLPRTRHKSLVEVGNRNKHLDVMDPDLWEEMGWAMAARDQDGVLQNLLPGVSDPAERRRIALDHQRKSLERAKDFHAALDVPASPPEGTNLYLLAGDAVPTKKVTAVDRGTGDVELIDHGAGDGTVLRSSALMDERIGGTWSPNLRSPIDWTDVMFLFSDHLGMTKDPGFSDNVLYLLLEDPRGSGISEGRLEP